MKVCIAEKPSVAKEIAEILGAKTRKDGYFEGNGYQVTWTFGHLCTLKEPGEYADKWQKWNIYNLPILPERFDIKLISNSGVEKQFKTIEYLVNACEEVINCGDAGQEGELIQRWVLKHANCNKPMKRLWISSLTEEAIREGFNKLQDQSNFEKLYFAGSSRAIGDWLLGMNATRAYTLKYGNGKQVLSIGRVQTPTLALIVNRQHEIDNFKSETYWEIKTVYRDVVFSNTKGRFTDKEKATKIIEEIKTEPFVIKSFSKKEGKEQSPKLFDLTSVQVECNRRLGFSADDTLKIAQSLYEKKVITYPRVDTTYLSEDIYPKVPTILKGLSNYSQLTAPLLESTIRKSKKVFDDKKVTDHHAIIPTGVTANGLNSNETKVYDMISKRFIAAFYPDCTVSNTVVVGEVKEAEFKASGKQIIEEGWRVVFSDEQQTKDETINEVEGEQVLPLFEEGERGPHYPDIAEKQTQAPKYYTEASLLRAMETAGKQVEDDELREVLKENGIGRPSTRANIIETLFKRKYIVRDKKRLVATVTGIQLIGCIKNDLLKSAELTGQWEHKLRQIERGEYLAKSFLQDMNKMVSDLVYEVQMDKESGRIEVGAVLQKEKKAKKSKEIACPKCKEGAILKGKAAFGCSHWKEGCDFRFPLEFMGKKPNENQLSQLITKGKTTLIKGVEVDGEKQNGYFKWDGEVLHFESDKPKELLCPKCKQAALIKGKAAYGCRRWSEGCKFIVPFEFMGKKLSENQIEELISKGETITIKGFERNGEKVDGKLKLMDDFSIGLN